jgi:uncharacterized protein with beta-barrel porin domain
MNFKKTLIASSISAASMALTPVAVNAVTISSVLTPSFTEVTLDATGLLITNTGGIDLSTSSFSFPALRVDSSLTADIDINAGGFINAVNTGITVGSTVNPTGILFATIEGGPGLLTGSITNNGTITAEDAGIFLSNGSSLTGDIINTGDITSNATSLTSGSAIQIQQNINPSSPGTGTTGGFDERSMLDGSITNSGTIEGIGFGNGINVNVGEITGTITNNAGGTISSESDAAIFINSSNVGGGIVNNATIAGDGGILIANEFLHTATFNGGISNNAGGSITGGNFGAIEIGTGATFTGGINNAGTITASTEDTAAIDIFGDIIQGVLFPTSFSGDIVNSGTIENTATGVSAVSETAAAIWLSAVTVDGSINNTGTISSAERSAILLEGFQEGPSANYTVPDTVLTGSIVNTGGSGGVISGVNGIRINGSIVSNDIDNAGGTITGLLAGIGLTNTKIVVDDSGSTVTTVQSGITNIGGSITNSGTIQNIANANTISTLVAQGVSAEAIAAIALNSSAIIGGDIINTAAGSISTVSANAISIGDSVLTDTPTLMGDINNSGDIVSPEMSAILIDNGAIGGSIINAEGGTIDGAVGGIVAINSTITGDLINAGAINSLGPDAPILSNAYAIDIQNSTIGAINNGITGVITGGFILEQSTMGGNFTNAGILQSATDGGDAYVVRGVNSTQGDLINSGTIAAVTLNAAVIVEQGAVLANIVNSGTIDGGAAAIAVNDGGSQIGTITNNVGGVLNGGGFGAISALNGGAIGAVVNDGTINGTTDFGTGGGSFTNSGNADAVVGAELVTNTGSLGDVVLVATGGTFGNAGGTAGNISNAVGSVGNDGTLGDVSFLDVTGNIFFSTGSAGDITNVDFVTNSSGDIGNVTFQSMATGIYTSVGNTSVGTIDGATIIEVLMDPQSAAGVTTATVDGDLGFNGLLFVQAGSTGAGINDYSRLAVTGNADVTGASVFVLANGIDLFAQGDGFDFLTAGGELTSDISAFSACDLEIDSSCETPVMSITDNSTVLDFKVVQNGNTLRAVVGDVTFTNPLPTDGNTGNKNVSGVAGSLSAIALAPQPTPPGAPAFSTTPLGVAINRMVTLGDQQGLDALAKALGSLDAETVEGGSLSALQADTVAAATIDNRTAALRGYYGFSGTMAGDPLAINGFWLQGYGNETDQGIRDGVDGFDADTYGVGIGADAPLGERVILGVAFSYADTDVNMKQESRNQMIIDSYRLSVYGSYNADDYYLDGQLAYAMNDYETERAISPLLTVSPLIAKGKHDGDQYNMRIRGGYPIATESGWFVTPTAEVNYTFLSEDSYTERGAGNLGLQLAADDVEVLVLSVGVKMAYPITTKNEVTWIPEFSLNYAYDTIGDEVEVDSNFVGVTGAAFITNGANVEQEALKAGFKVRAFSQGNFSFSAGYDYVDKQDYDSQSLSATVRYDF